MSLSVLCLAMVTIPCRYFQVILSLSQISSGRLALLALIWLANLEHQRICFQLCQNFTIHSMEMPRDPKLCLPSHLQHWFCCHSLEFLLLYVQSKHPSESQFPITIVIACQTLVVVPTWRGHSLPICSIEPYGDCICEFSLGNVILILHILVATDDYASNASSFFAFVHFFVLGTPSSVTTCDASQSQAQDTITIPTHTNHLFFQYRVSAVNDKHVPCIDSSRYVCFSSSGYLSLVVKTGKFIVCASSYSSIWHGIWISFVCRVDVFESATHL